MNSAPSATSAWYEMYPAPETMIPDMAITPGDTMTASVTTDGAGDFTLTLIDDTTGVSKTVSAHSAARGYSAEVIAEAPTDATTGTQYPLADFGTANFSNCTIDGEPIADSAWRQIDMVDESSDTPLATPTTLGTDGASFSVACDVTPPPVPVPSWQMQYQGTTGSPYFLGAAFANDSDGWAVGYATNSSATGTIVGTTDGGSEWSTQYTETAYNNTINGVAAADASDAWAVGSCASPCSGTILATTDGGSEWTTQYSDPSNRFWGVSFANALDGWAVGDDGSAAGVILATTDGGTDWTEQYHGSSDGLLGVSFVNSKDGWAVGMRDVILATTDGGTTWDRQYIDTTSTNSLSGVAFANTSDGWAVGPDGILATTNGGTSWNLQSPAIATGVCCTSADDVWVSTSGGIMASANGGSTWTSQNLYPTYGLGLKGIACAYSNHLWAVGGSAYLGGGTIDATTDGGWPAPTGLGFSPASGMVGNTIVLTGTGLASATSVRFDGVSARFTVASDTQIAATVPAGATSGPIIVTTPGGTVVSSSRFTVLGPTLTSFAPQSGRLRDLVTLVGSGFTGATSVKFNGHAASFTVTGDTLITASVPFGATRGPITMTSPEGSVSSATSFTVMATTARLSLTVSGLAHGSLRLGRQLAMKAVLTPANLAGSKITFTIQHKRSGKWRTLSTLVRTTSTSGRCTVGCKPGGRGAYRVRVTMRQTSTNTSASTIWRDFTVSSRVRASKGICPRTHRA